MYGEGAHLCDQLRLLELAVGDGGLSALVNLGAPHARLERGLGRHGAARRKDVVLTAGEVVRLQRLAAAAGRQAPQSLLPCERALVLAALPVIVSVGATGGGGEGSRGGPRRQRRASSERGVAAGGCPLSPRQAGRAAGLLRDPRRGLGRAPLVDGGDLMRPGAEEAEERVGGHWGAQRWRHLKRPFVPKSVCRGLHPEAPCPLWPGGRCGCVGPSVNHLWQALALSLALV